MQISRLLGLAASLLLALQDVTGYEQDHNFTVPIRSRINKITPLFGLDAGGHVSIDMEVFAVGWPRKQPPPWLNVYLVFFNLQQWYEYDLRTYIPSNDYTFACQNDDAQCVSLCSLPSVKRYQIWGSPHDPRSKRSVEFDIEERTEYTLALLTCAASTHDDSINVEMSVRMINPGNQHLSVEQIPLEGMYWTLVVAYVLLLGGAAWAMRNGFPGMLLHKLLLAAMGVKLVELWCNLVYYRHLSRSGSDVVALYQATKFGAICADAAFLGLLLLMSLGYTITRETLSRRERQLLWGFFVLYGLFGLLHSVCTAPVYCQGFLLAFYVVKFLITFCIIVAMNANIERLRAGSLDLHRPFSPTQLYLKLLIFHNIRWAFFAVLVFPILLMFVEVAVLSWEQSWVGPLLQELLYLGVFLLIASTFRFHRPQPPAEPEAEEPQGEGDDAEQGEGEGAAGGGGGQGGAEIVPGGGERERGEAELEEGQLGGGAWDDAVRAGGARARAEGGSPAGSDSAGREGRAGASYRSTPLSSPRPPNGAVSVSGVSVHSARPD